MKETVKIPAMFRDQEINKLNIDEAGVLGEAFAEVHRGTHLENIQAAERI